MPDNDARTHERSTDVLSSLLHVPLRSADTPDSEPSVNDAHAELAAALLRVARSGLSEVVLTWPAPPDGLTAVHALASLGVTARCGAEPPVPLRVAYFPWTSRAGDSAKRTLVDCGWVVKAHQQALNRALAGHANTRADQALRFHYAMVRLQDLNGEVLYRGRKRTLGQYRHPALAEVAASGLGDSTDKPLLYRTRRFTTINKYHFDDVDALSNCPFALVGIPDDDAFVMPLSRTGDVQAILLNGLLRRWEALGDVWIQRVETALARARTAWRRPLPVLAITDDPWMQWVLRKEILPKHHADSKAGIRATTILMEPARIFEKRPPFEAIGADSLDFYSPGGAPAAIESSFRSLIKDAGSMEEHDVLDLLLESRRAFRSLASLPASLGAWRTYLLHDADMSPEEAADVIGRLNPTQALSRIDAEYPQELSVQANSELLSKLRSDLRDFIDRHTTSEGAVAGVFQQLLQSCEASNEPVAVVIPDERVREFVEHGIAQRFAQRGDSEDATRNVLVYSLPQFMALAHAVVASPAPFTSAILLGLTRRPLMQLLSARWLPKHLAIIADVTTVGHVAANAVRLERRPELKALSERLSRVYLRADACLKHCSPDLPGVEFDRPPPPEYEGQGLGGVIDLTGNAANDSGPRLTLRVDTGAVILCRPKSTIVLFDAEDPVDPFRAASAEQIRPGDRVCVLGRGFFEAVKEQLGSSAAVAAEVRSYHHFVAEKIRSYPGVSFSEKASRITREMALKSCVVSESRVGDWIRADRWLKQGDTTVRPHAPWHYRDFSIFLGVLNAPEPLITKFWHFGVLATRSIRLSAALQFYELCIAILTKYHDMVAQDPARARDFSDIRAKAEATAATVTMLIGPEPETAVERTRRQLALNG